LYEVDGDKALRLVAEVETVCPYGFGLIVPQRASVHAKILSKEGAAEAAAVEIWYEHLSGELYLAVNVTKPLS